MRDLAALVALLLDQLRRAGVAADSRGAEALATALPGVLSSGGDRRSRMYWTARVTLVRDPRDFVTFDRIFGNLFGAPGGPTGAVVVASALRPDRRPNGGKVLVPQADLPVTEGEATLPWTTRPRATQVGSADSRERLVPNPSPGTRPRTSPAPFEEFDEQILAEIAQRLRDAARRRPHRQTRRRQVGGRGRPDLRRSAQRWRRTGGEPLHLVRTRPRRRPRRLVVICDVSESMQPYVTTLLHLMRAASLDNAETFAFGTSLTRVSQALRGHTPVDAVTEASAAVSDRFAGTRIASSLQSLLRSHHGELLRGAVVVIASDGWDTDPPEQLGRQMARIARRAHRVVWLNPRAGQPGYQPLAGGMAAALPYCDVLLPAATLDDLADVVDVLSSTALRRPLDGTG